MLSTLIAASLLCAQPGPNADATIVLPGRAPIDQALFNPDGRRVYFATHAGVEGYDIDTGKRLFDVSYGRQIEISPEGNLLAALQINIGMISVGGTVSVLDATTGKLLHQSPGTSAAFSPDSRWLISQSSYTVGYPAKDEPPKVQITDLRNGKMHLAQFGTHVGKNPGWGRAPSGYYAFTKDGKTLVFRARNNSGQHQMIAACDLETGKVLEKLPAANELQRELSPSYSDDGKRYVHSWTVHDVDKGTPLCKIEIPKHVKSGGWYATFQISPDGALVYSASSRPRTVSEDEKTGRKTMSLASQLHVWDAETGKWKQTIADAKLVKSVPMVTIKKLGNFPSTEPRFILNQQCTRAIDYGDDSVNVWDLKTGKVIRTFRNTGHTMRPEILRFSPDGKWIATASTSGEVALWDAQTGQPGRGTELAAAIGDVCFRPKSNELLGVGYGLMYVWDVATGDLKRTTEHQGNWFRVPCHPEGKLAAVADYQNDAVTILDLENGKSVHRLAGRANSLEFTPKGDVLLALGSHGNVTLWDTATGKQLKYWPSGKANDYRYTARRAVFLPGAQRFLLCENDAVAVVEVATGKREREFSLKNESRNQTQDADVHPDGKRFVVAYSGKADIEERDLETGKVLRTYPGYTYGASQARYSPDGARLATLGSYSYETRIHAVSGYSK